jgi:arylsulfatase A-like enzyme
MAARYTRRRMRRPPIFLLAGALLLASACPGSRATAPWQRLALWTVAPNVEEHPFGGRYVPLVRTVVSFLGTAEVRDLARVPEKQLIAFPHRPAGQVEALETALNARLAWHVTLGDTPYLSFTPLGCGAPCSFHAAVRTSDGQLIALHQSAHGAIPTFAPAAVELDLERWEGQAVDLVLEADGEVAAGTPPAQWPRATWATPVVYWRTHADAPPALAHPNILLIGVDTLRADAVGPRGDRPSLTPSIDRLASESDVYADAYTVFNVTNPSFASIHTGLYGKNHGVYDLQTPLAPGQQTLAQRLSAAGYDTFAVISARHLGDHNSGLGRGFAHVVEATEHLSAEMATGAAWELLATARAPFFAWVHVFDPHTPHTPPNPYANGERPALASGAGRVLGWTPFRALGPRAFDEPVLGGQRDLYDGEVAYTDREIGRLLDALASRGRLADTVVVLVADHGENLGEHGILYRHSGLWETTTHVPMMVRWPGAAQQGRVLHGFAQTIDLFPTLLRAAGLPRAPSDGFDLGELFDERRHGRRLVFAEPSGGGGAMVRTERYKYYTSKGESQVPEGTYLFDLTADPGETRNLAGQGLAIETDLGEVLRLWRADHRGAPVGAPQSLSDEDRARLKALGYL